MVNNKKRKILDAEAVASCLHLRGASETTVLAIQNRRAQENEKWSKGTFWRRVSEYYAPLQKCYCRLTLQGTRGSELDFWVADAQAMLQEVAAKSSQWCSMLQAALARTATLRVLLYHDECTAGNILSPQKKLKATIWYLTFQEFGHVTAKENAWLPVALLQHHVADTVLGGVSAATVKVLQHILQPANRQGFDLNMGAHGARARVQLAPTALFIADHDAQRATYCNKGSSGYKPCLWCANLLKRDAPQAATGSGRFVDICESRFHSFHIASDSEIFAAADHLAAIATAGERARMQKAYGFNFVPGSLLQDADTRERLPPSCACNDVLHAYFVNGVASWEVGLAMRELQSIRDLDALWQLVQDEGWQPRAETAGELKSCFRSTLYDSNDGFKGNGALCWNFVFLLYYLVHKLLHKAELKPAVCRSFFLLKSISAELRRLKASKRPLASADVQMLHRLQQQHQEAWPQAWGRETMRPKHHHRLHLPAGCVTLSFLPNCETQESKHRVYKSYIAAHQRAHVNVSSKFQIALLSRLLNVTLRESEEHGLLLPPELLKPFRPASCELRAFASDPDLQSGKALRFGKLLIRPQDVIMWDDKAAQVLECFRGRSGFCVLTVRLQLLRKHAWGSVWQTTDRQTLLPLTPSADINLPLYMRCVGNTISCLH
ncbi:unnamed protein product [Symbiodinium sp. CCMP2592]|nr:unnamed protein product [Symbiodinium sp. CCMP2592]